MNSYETLSNGHKYQIALQLLFYKTLAYITMHNPGNLPQALSPTTLYGYLCAHLHLYQSCVTPTNTVTKIDLKT